MKKRFILIFFVPFFIGCIHSGTVYRVTETKDKDGRILTERSEFHNESDTTRQSSSSRSSIMENPFDTIKNKKSDKNDHEPMYKFNISTFGFVPDNEPYEPEDSDYPLTTSISYGSSRLWSDFTSNFNTNFMPISKWKNSLPIGGKGYEFECWINDRQDHSNSAYGMKISNYSNNLTNNLMTGNGYYVSENIKSELFTFSLNKKSYFYDFLYGVFGFGVTSYKIKTNVSTNLPQYSYEGIEGNSTYVVNNLGLGVLWPQYKVFKLKIELGCVIPLNNINFIIPLSDLNIEESSSDYINIGCHYNFGYNSEE